MFVFKYSSSGTNNRTKLLGTSSDEVGYGISVDSSDNIYVVGETEGGLDGYISSGGKDIIVIKYNSNLTKQWSQQIGTSNNESDRAVAVDSLNNIYVTGYTFGGLDGNTNLGSSDIFLMKFNSSGVKIWTKQLGSSALDVSLQIYIDQTDYIYVTGYTYGGLDGNTNSGSRDIFLMKFNSSGVKQ